jgi:hypothetical protein
MGAAGGSVDVTTCPLLSTAAQKWTVGQLMAVNESAPITLVTCHAPMLPEGLVEVMTLPTSSVATQSFTAGQEIAVNPEAESVSVPAQVVPGRTSGNVTLNTTPDGLRYGEMPPTATQSVGVGHEIAVRAARRSRTRKVCADMLACGFRVAEMMT